MPFLLVSLRRSEDPEEAKRLLRRFSPMALVGAGTVLLGGLGMAWMYLGISDGKSLNALYGTAYGVMMISKLYLLLLVMAMGAGNFFLVRRIDTAPVSSVDAAAAIWRGGDRAGLHGSVGGGFDDLATASDRLAKRAGKRR